MHCVWLGLVLGLAVCGDGDPGALVDCGRNRLRVACTAGALLGMTAGTLWEKRFGVSLHPILSNLIQYAVGLLGTLPLAIATESLAISWTGEFATALAYLVIANSLVAMTLLLAMIRHGEVSRVSSLFYLVPPVTALIAWPLLGEAMPPLGWAGMALAAIGVALASRRRA